MPRMGSRKAYGQRLERIGLGHWRMHWVVDFKVDGQRIRYPRSYQRDTDFDGALRFAEKHGLQQPRESMR